MSDATDHFRASAIFRLTIRGSFANIGYQDRDMNSNYTNSTTAPKGWVGVCAGTVAAEAAAEGDTMSSEGWGA